jgi:hypothetical protein
MQDEKNREGRSFKRRLRCKDSYLDIHVKKVRLLCVEEKRNFEHEEEKIKARQENREKSV